jgi:hypothetical protein
LVSYSPNSVKRGQELGQKGANMTIASDFEIGAAVERAVEHFVEGYN